MNVSLVVNPEAGNRAYKSISKLETLLKEVSSLTSCITSKRGDAFEFAKTVQHSDRIVVASGDGTINEVINGILNSVHPETKNIPISLIPLGTSNVLAKELGIPHTVEKAVQVALSGAARKVSLGRLNERYFSLMAGIGFDGETVRGVKNDVIKKISGKAAHIVSGIKVLKTYSPPLLKIKTDEEECTGYTAVVSNIRCYAGNFHVTPEASITEPLLDVCVFSGKTRKDVLRFVRGVIFKRHLVYPDVSYIKASTIEITSDHTVHVQIDGDYFGTLPVIIDVVKDAIQLIW